MPKRFSISTLLLVTSVVGLVIALVLARSDLSNKDAENQKLRLEAGHFDIADHTLAYARQLKCRIPNAWRFRLYLPEDAKVHLGLFHGGNDPLSSHESKLSHSLMAGEYVCTIYLQKREHGTWFSTAYNQGFSGGSDGSLATHPMFEKILSEDWSSLLEADFPHGPLTSSNFYSGEILPLVSFPKVVITDSGDSPNGAAIWIEPAN